MPTIDPDWKETDAPTAPAFSTSQLLPIEMPSYVSLKFGVDPAPVAARRRLGKADAAEDVGKGARRGVDPAARESLHPGASLVGLVGRADAGPEPG